MILYIEGVRGQYGFASSTHATWPNECRFLLLVGIDRSIPFFLVNHIRLDTHCTMGMGANNLLAD